MKKILLTFTCAMLSLALFAQTKWIAVNTGVGGTMMTFSLYEKQSDNSYEMIDAVNEDSGNWLFDSLASGVYRIHVSIEYDKYLPTWHPRQALWEDAEDIDLTSVDSFVCNAGMLPNPVHIGPCGISGVITEGQLFAPGDPLKNTRVLLYRDSVLITMTSTNDSGSFSKTNLPVGTYTIRTDVVNTNDQNPKTVTVDSTNTTATVNLTVNKNGTSNTGLNKVRTASFKIYPNPSNGNFMVLKSGKFTADIWDMRGHKVGSYKGFNMLRIDLSENPVGMYFIQVKAGNKTEFQRIVVQ